MGTRFEPPQPPRQLALAVLLALAAPASEIRLGFTSANNAAVDRILATPGVTVLDLARCEITDAGFERLKDLPAVTDLNLFYAEFLTDAAMSHLRGWKHLRRLNLRGTDITDAGLAHVSRISSLESLDASFTLVTNVGLDHLARLTKLQELALGGNKITAAGLHVLKGLSELRRLNLNGSQKRNTETWSASLTDFDTDALTALSRLEDLNIGGTRITDLGVGRLAALANLRVLDLSRTAATGAGLERLARLERLSLWKSRATDESAARLAGLRQLRFLDLADTSVTDRTLEPLASLPALADLYLDGTRVTAEGVDRFAKARPQCRVHWK